MSVVIQKKKRVWTIVTYDRRDDGMQWQSRELVLNWMFEKGNKIY